VTLGLWLLERTETMNGVAQLLMFPGNAIGSVLFGHDNPLALFLASVCVNFTIYTAVFYCGTRLYHAVKSSA
jgi:hypothetical protein